MTQILDKETQSLLNRFKQTFKQAMLPVKYYKVSVFMYLAGKTRKSPNPFDPNNEVSPYEDLASYTALATSFTKIKTFLDKYPLLYMHHKDYSEELLYILGRSVIISEIPTYVVLSPMFFAKKNYYDLRDQAMFDPLGDNLLDDIQVLVVSDFDSFVTRKTEDKEYTELVHRFITFLEICHARGIKVIMSGRLDLTESPVLQEVSYSFYQKAVIKHADANLWDSVS